MSAVTLTVFASLSHDNVSGFFAPAFTTVGVTVDDAVISLSYWSTAFTLTELVTLLTFLEIVKDVFPSVTFVSFPVAVTTTGKDLITFPSLFNTLMYAFPSLIPLTVTPVVLLVNGVFGNKRIESSLDTTEYSL